MFQQLLTPVGDSLGLSFVVAILPIVAVLILLGLLRRPAWQAALCGLILGLVIAVVAWKMPLDLAINSVLNGAVFALWPVMWIVINALLLYNIAPGFTLCFLGAAQRHNLVYQLHAAFLVSSLSIHVPSLFLRRILPRMSILNRLNIYSGESTADLGRAGTRYHYRHTHSVWSF